MAPESAKTPGTEHGPGEIARVEKEALISAWKEVLRAQRSALRQLYQENAISEAVYIELAKEVAEALVAPGKESS